MEHFAVLGISTAIIAVLAWAVYRRTQDVGTVIGTAALYYWSLFGAWSVIVDKRGGFSGKHYAYLETKMFPIELDGDYLLALGLYAGFIVFIQLALLATASGRRAGPLPRLVLRHEPILLLSAVAALASLLLVRDKLSAAWALNTSAYWYTRMHPDEWFTLHQVLNRAALLPAAIGLAALAAGGESRYFVNVERRYTRAGYAVVLGGMCLFTFVLGNKNEVFTALVVGLLAYVQGTRRVRWMRAALVVALGLWFLYAIDFFRSYPISEMREAVAGRLKEATHVRQFVTSSNETFAAHFSMYGVLHRNVEPRFGYSLYALACSVVPRLFWPGRPPDIYLYYSESVGTVQNQGYSLHHATGWYLNFGIPGVALGAVALGLTWSYFRQAHRRVGRRTGLPFRLFATVAPWFFVACLPPMLRAGPESYKGLLVEGVVIPVVVLTLACRRRRRRAALIWNKAQGWRIEPAGRGVA